jgi:hypothetical protein
VSELAGRNAISRKQEEAVTLFETVTGYICKSTAERESHFRLMSPEPAGGEALTG